MTNPLLFLLAVLTVLATPGPTNTLLASAAALKGVRGALRCFWPNSSATS